MIKSLLGVVAGAAAALQADRWFAARRARLGSGGIAGALLERVNRTLERRRSGTEPR